MEHQYLKGQFQMIKENIYRTVSCGELREENIGQQVRVAGWVENIRDHGGVMFLDIRDEYGVLQVVVHDDALLKNINKECTVTLSGEVVKRDEETINRKIATGYVEVHTEDITVLGKCKNVLPFEVATSTNTGEDVRLKYRFLDLRNPKVHENILFRSRVVAFLRQKMQEMGFNEINTPILSTSSPEGARDYLIPSRKHKGKFYALPQAPQIFKQLLMVSGFDRYFQIAPCFRDEDARADRSPGEFYQLDFEMAFATQEDVFAVAEEVLYETFTKFSDKEVSKPPFRRIPFAEAMVTYGTDKPDLRNPLIIKEISDMFAETDFAPFRRKTVRSINVPNAASQSKKWFKRMEEFALSIGMKPRGADRAQRLQGRRRDLLHRRHRAGGSQARGTDPHRGSEPSRIDRHRQIRDVLHRRLPDVRARRRRQDHLHPQPLLDAAGRTNGVELSSGAVRNHDIEIMKKAFDMAGYSEDDLKAKFSALYNAFQYGAPPHAGMAPGVDRMLMLLKDEENIREVIAFPMNSNAQDVLLGAPGEVTEQQLREVHVKLR